MLRPALLAAVAALLLLAAPAGAQRSATLGPGDQPDVVTDAAGTGHVVWRRRTSPPIVDDVLYCPVPAGSTTGCGRPPVALPSPDGDGDGRGDVAGTHPFVFQAPDGRLIVLGEVINAGLVTWQSADGGATFTGPEVVGGGRVSDIDAAALSPDGTRIAALGGNSEAQFTVLPVTGGREDRVIELGNGGFGDGHDVGWLADGRVMVSLDSDDRTSWRTSGSDPMDLGQWSPVTTSFAGRGRIATAGPGAALLATGARPAHRLSVLRFDGRTFTAPRTLLTKPAPWDRTDLHADPSGRLHVAAAGVLVPACGRGSCIVYRRQTATGFTQAVPYYLGGAQGFPPSEIELSANASGAGWLVRHSAADRDVRVLPLVTPPPGSETPTRRIAGRTRITAPLPAGCVPVGRDYTQRLVVSGRRRGVRILRVRLAIDGRRVVTDRRAPFVRTLRLDLPAGSRHTASARVTYRVGSRTRSAAVGRQVVMCP